MPFCQPTVLEAIDSPFIRLQCIFGSQESVRGPEMEILGKVIALGRSVAGSHVGDSIIVV